MAGSPTAAEPGGNSCVFYVVLTAVG